MGEARQPQRRTKRRASLRRGEGPPKHVERNSRASFNPRPRRAAKPIGFAMLIRGLSRLSVAPCSATATVKDPGSARRRCACAAGRGRGWSELREHCVPPSGAIRFAQVKGANLLRPTALSLPLLERIRGLRAQDQKKQNYDQRSKFGKCAISTDGISSKEHQTGILCNDRKYEKTEQKTPCGDGRRIPYVSRSLHRK